MDGRLRDAEELFASRARLVVAGDAERRDLERALHDGVQQQLVALAVELQLAQQLQRDDPAAGAASLEQVRRDLLRAVDELRGFADLLYPPLLDEQGLGAALCAAAARAGVPARVELPPDCAVRAEVALTVYLCCVRTLAGSRCTSLHAGCEDGVVRFEVVAADARAAAEATSSLIDRVEALGGQLVTNGDRITGSFPVRE